MVLECTIFCNKDSALFSSPHQRKKKERERGEKLSTEPHLQHGTQHEVQKGKVIKR